MKNKQPKLATKKPALRRQKPRMCGWRGTFEVLVPVPDRANKPHKVPLQFATLNAEAEAWLHSAEGRETVAREFSTKAKKTK